MNYSSITDPTVVFTVRLHVMQRHDIAKAILSVRSSIKRVDCDKNERNLCPHSYTTRKIIHPNSS